MIAFRKSFVSVCQWFFYLTMLFLGGLAFLDYRYQFLPCILSYLERLTLFALVVLFWFGYSYRHSIVSKKITSWIGLIFSLFGVVTVSKHLWLQYASSSAKYSHLNAANSLFDALKQAFLGYPSGCAQIYPLFWNISVTAIILFFFILFTMICFWLLVRRE